MANNQETFVSVIDKALGLGRRWFAGEDAYGPYVAVRIAGGRFRDEYFLIDPEYRADILQREWKTTGAGNIAYVKDLKKLMLSQYIWQNCLKRLPVGDLYARRHIHDLRAGALMVQKRPESGFYGVTTTSKRGFQVSFCCGGDKIYIGSASTKEDAARLYNDELQRRKRREELKQPGNKNWRIIYMDYNDVTPLFTAEEKPSAR